MNHLLRFAMCLVCIKKVFCAMINEEIELSPYPGQIKNVLLIEEEHKIQQTLDISVNPQEQEKSFLVSSHEANEHVKSWLYDDIINPQELLSKNINDFLFVFGAGSAIARGSVYFILGYYLSENLLVSSMNNPGHYVISSVYGALASIPMTILGTKSSHKFFKYILTPTSQSQRKIERKMQQYEKIFVFSKNIILGGGAACSSSILTSIAYFSFYDLIGWFWLVPGIPTFYVRTLIDYYAMNHLGEAIYHKFVSEPRNKKLSTVAPNSREASIYTIEEKINKAKSYIDALNYKQSKLLEDIIKDPNEPPNKKLKVCMHPELFLENSSSVIIKKSNIFRDFVGYLGGAVAIGGMYLYYKGTRDGFRFTQDLFNLSDQETLNAQNSLAAISLVTASSLSAIAAHSSTLKFYDLITDVSARTYNYVYPNAVISHHSDITPLVSLTQTQEDFAYRRKRMAVAGFAFFLACCDALTLYQVATLQSLDLNQSLNIFSLIASSISLFTMSFWAVDEGIMNYVRGGEPKATMQNILENIESSIVKMDDKTLAALRYYITDDSALLA